MSYDLMVFRKESAPKTSLDDFFEWYEEKTQWKEGHNYDNPEVTTENLKNWFMEMVQDFPAMNGPFAKDAEDEESITDYSIGKEFIYASFAWSKADEVYEAATKLAEKHNVGFFDVSSAEGEVLIPGEEGGIPAV